MVGYSCDGGGAVLYDEGGEEFAYGTGEGLSRWGNNTRIDEDVGERVRKWMLLAKGFWYFIHIRDASFRCDFLTARYHLASSKERTKCVLFTFSLITKWGTARLPLVMQNCCSR